MGEICYLHTYIYTYMAVWLKGGKEALGFITTCQALLQFSKHSSDLQCVRGHGCLHSGMSAFFLFLLDCRAVCFFPTEGVKIVTTKVMQRYDVKV